jgi:hypothetical protein
VKDEPPTFNEMKAYIQAAEKIERCLEEVKRELTTALAADIAAERGDLGSVIMIEAFEDCFVVQLNPIFARLEEDVAPLWEKAEKIVAQQKLRDARKV